MKARQICARLRYQGSQLGDEVQSFEYDVRGAIAIRCLQLVADISVGGQRQTLLRHSRPRNVAAKSLESVALVNLGRYPRMQREARFLRHSVRTTRRSADGFGFKK